MKNTEKINENTQDLDLKTSEEFVEICIEEDKKVLEAIAGAKTQIANVIDLVYEKVKDSEEVYLPYLGSENYKGPKVFYFGAGTSGRLGILDASECPPTFSAHPDFINGVIAGGAEAVTGAVENAEDNEEAACKFVTNNLSSRDVAIGVSANGNAPFVKSALSSAKKLGALTIAIANNEDAGIFDIVDEKIFLDTGAEILTGSTRMKAGTSQKLVLNMISTGLMVKLGKVYGNLMVDLQAKNQKLRQRASNLVMKITDSSEAEAKKALEESGYRVKDSVLMIKNKLSASEAAKLLKAKQYNLRLALEK
tara:strand:- start:124 stop:1047 length:924 start_codon:yes stop_codon:yes gene_type:complete